MDETRNLAPPYWAATEDELISYDFNRELVPPGTNDIFPDGAVGVRVDDDFFTVAALPWDRRNEPIESIVRDLWPGKFENAQFMPDSGGEEG